jgi:acetylornithine/N-succinyldiaminopimelate aminotransferase
MLTLKKTEFTNASLHAMDQRYYLPTFKRYPIALARGQGSTVWDVEGNAYIDALAGIAVSNVGHSHPTVVAAIQRQAENLVHISNFYVSVPQMQLAERLVQLSGLARVFFCNSGAEALEGAFKIARRYAHSLGRGGTIFALKGAFHGRTLATIATGKPAMQQGFGPMPQGFQVLPFNDLSAIEAAYSEDMAAIVVEPIQGEGGVRPADAEFLRALRAFCDAHQVALIFDEVQTGVGRTGKWFAKDHAGVQPDIMTLAKGLGSGVPIGAILANEAISGAIQWGDHGTTFGGNPLACAAALATLEVIEEENLLQVATTEGQWLREQVKAWEHPLVHEVRGAGLMVGIELTHSAKPIVLDLLHQGILANATAEKVIRLVPPLNTPRETLQTVMTALYTALQNHWQELEDSHV